MSTSKSPGAAVPHPQSFWLWIMCLTGVDYFSTLGYQPSIAFEAAGKLSPLATILLVLVTLLCALPVYRCVASKSPHGQGSISMLEKLLPGWWGKFLVLIMLGFAATDFVITKTLSAADAAEHLIHNPMWESAPAIAHNQILVTMVMLIFLGALFLRGFREVIAICVVLVAAYLLLNGIVIGSGVRYLMTHRELIEQWWSDVRLGNWMIAHPPIASKGFWGTIGVCVLIFPKLALGLSGFETGVAVMPLVRGDATDHPETPLGRIRNTRRLLGAAAGIMSTMLLGSSLVTTMLIAPEELAEGGEAANRALSFVAHGETPFHINPWFGHAFGTIYDLCTVSVLWFAGASAMSGLLNLIPRYLPRYGMAPSWAAAFRPLVLVFTLINVAVTWWFDASVTAQGDAYATGVLVLMTSASVAVCVSQWTRNIQKITQWNWGARLRSLPWRYLIITGIFLYTTLTIIISKPVGMKIATGFILSVIVVSFLSRTRRSLELRFEHFEFVDQQSRVLWDSIRYLEFPVLVPHRPGQHSITEKDRSIRLDHRLPETVPLVFVEANLGDPSEFSQTPLLSIVSEQDHFIVRLTGCVSIPHAIAALALEIAKTGPPPEIHFGWSEESPAAANLKFLFLGQGNVPWMVRELLLKAEPVESRRPRVIVG